MTASIKIHVLHCGRVRVDRSLPFKEKTWHPAPFTGWFRKPEYQIWLPVSSYLVEHPKGLVLLDTGWHTDVRTDQVKHLGRFHYSINKADLPEGQAIHEQLGGQAWISEPISSAHPTTVRRKLPSICSGTARSCSSTPPGIRLGSYRRSSRQTARRSSSMEMSGMHGNPGKR